MVVSRRCMSPLTCASLLAVWIPHYLTWPWFRDLDAFATMAQSWDAGILPYRDIQAYNFPGQVYLLWILGKILGWGHPAAFYALDVVLLLVLGAALAVWSRRRFGGSLPGLVGYLAFLATYLNLDYGQVAQRDWQAACLVVLALLSLQAWPGRRGRIASALLVALAFSLRPHVLLLLPAIASAIDERARGRRTAAPRPCCARSPTGRRSSWWASSSCLRRCGWPECCLISCAGCVSWRTVGPYDQTAPGQAVQAFIDQLRHGWTFVALAAGLLLAFAGPPERRRLARTWTLAMCAVLLYKPLHPVQHLYLLRPLELVSAVLVAVSVAGIASLQSLARPIALLRDSGDGLSRRAGRPALREHRCEPRCVRAIDWGRQSRAPPDRRARVVRPYGCRRGRLSLERLPVGLSYLRRTRARRRSWGTS